MNQSYKIQREKDTLLPSLKRNFCQDKLWSSLQEVSFEMCSPEGFRTFFPKSIEKYHCFNLPLQHFLTIHVSHTHFKRNIGFILFSTVPWTHLRRSLCTTVRGRVQLQNMAPYSSTSHWSSQPPLYQLHGKSSPASVEWTWSAKGKGVYIERRWEREYFFSSQW